MFLTEESFFSAADQYRNKEGTRYWGDAKRRWGYHKRSIEIIKQVSLGTPRILEIGTMGIPLSSESDLLDMALHKDFYSRKDLRYEHDLRCIPWPIEDRIYDWVVALRVYHHLWPMQRECFEEALRIGRNLILFVPAVKNHEVKQGTILPSEFRAWYSDIRPSIIEPMAEFGFLYAWIREK